MFPKTTVGHCYLYTSKQIIGKEIKWLSVTHHVSDSVEIKINDLWFLFHFFMFRCTLVLPKGKQNKKTKL